MTLATVIVSLLLAALLVFSAIRKLGHRPDVVATYARVGVPEDKLGLLAIVLLAAAAGIAGGLFWAPIGIAAAAGTVVYFLGAVGAHLRAHDTKPLPVPLTAMVLAGVVLALRLATRAWVLLQLTS